MYAMPKTSDTLSATVSGVPFFISGFILLRLDKWVVKVKFTVWWQFMGY